MRALSVRQPWAELIASGRKSVELRTWRTNHRGPLVIVSGAGLFRAPPESFGLSRSIPRGSLICLVDVVDVVPATAEHSPLACCDVSPGEWAWVLANPRRLPARPVKGQLMLFEFDLLGVLGDAPAAPPGTP